MIYGYDSLVLLTVTEFCDLKLKQHFIVLALFFLPSRPPSLPSSLR